MTCYIRNLRTPSVSLGLNLSLINRDHTFHAYFFFACSAGGTLPIGASGTIPAGITNSQFRQFAFVGHDTLLITEATTSVAGGLRIFRRLNKATGTTYNASVFVQDVVNASGPAYSYNIPVVAVRGNVAGVLQVVSIKHIGYLTSFILCFSPLPFFYRTALLLEWLG